MYVCKYIKKPKLFGDPTNFEVHSHLFLNVNDVKAAEVHRKLGKLFKESIMQKGMVIKWVRLMKYGCRMCVLREGSLKLVVKFEGVYALRFISSLSCEFSNVSSVLYKIGTEFLNYCNLCSC